MSLHQHCSILSCMLECARLAVGLLHWGSVQGIPACEVAQAGLQTQWAPGPCLAVCFMQLARGQAAEKEGVRSVCQDVWGPLGGAC